MSPQNLRRSTWYWLNMFRGYPSSIFARLPGVLSTWWFSISGIDALGRDDWRMTHLVLTKCVLLKDVKSSIYNHVISFILVAYAFIFFCPIDKKIYDIIMFTCFFLKSNFVYSILFSISESTMEHHGAWWSQKFAPQAAFISRLGELARSACVVLTVCTGALLLAATKLLDGVNATTNKVRQEGMVEA